MSGAERFALSERCFNHLDEMVSAQSVAFDAAGDRIYAGLTNEVRVFDVSVPGKECDTRKTWKKKSEGGQKGIVSCIATHPTIPNVYAVGTYRVVSQDSTKIRFDLFPN